MVSIYGAIGNDTNVTQHINIQQHIHQFDDYKKLNNDINEKKERLKNKEKHLKNIQESIDLQKSNLQFLPEPQKSSTQTLISKQEEEKRDIEQEIKNLKLDLKNLDDELKQWLKDFEIFYCELKSNSSNKMIEQFLYYLDKGEYQKAYAIFEELESENENNFIKFKNEGEKFSQECLLLARFEAIQYYNPNRIEKTCKFFDRALYASKTPKILFQYALFLDKNKKYDQAILLYHEAEKVLEQKADQDLSFLFSIMNNLANIYLAEHKLDAAEVTFEKVLQITEKLAQEQPDEYLHHRNIALNNLANLYSDQNKVDKAIDIYQQLLNGTKELDKKNLQDYLHRAIFMYNLADLHFKKNDLYQAENEYQESLQIIKEIREEIEKLELGEKDTYDCYCSFCHVKILNGLADLQHSKNRFDTAIDKCKEALQIAEELAGKNPNYKYLVDETLCKLNILCHDQSQF